MLSKGISLDTIQLLPSEIKTDLLFNVRPFASSQTQAEDELIQRLAVSLERDGQLDSLLITPERVLVCGHRRRKAALLINERRTARGQPLFRLRCTIDSSGGDLWQKSIISNLQRKDISPMDLAYLCKYIRDRFIWHGSQHTAAVGKYLGVDRSYVCRIESLLTASKEFQNQVHSGALSMDNALLLVKRVPNPATQATVIALAKDIQVEQTDDKIIHDWKAGKVGLKVAARRMLAPPRPRIERKAITRAMEEVGTVTRKAPGRSLSHTDLLAALNKLDDPALSTSHRNFLHYLLNTFLKGHGSQRELKAKYAAIGASQITLAS